MNNQYLVLAMRIPVSALAVSATLSMPVAFSGGGGVAIDNIAQWNGSTWSSLGST